MAYDPAKVIWTTFWCPACGKECETTMLDPVVTTCSCGYVRDPGASNEPSAEREREYAEALIKIVSRPWRWGEAWDGVNEESRHPYALCPGCRSSSFAEDLQHDASCPWLIAARALGCA